MSDTELLDMMERLRWIPFPSFKAIKTMIPNQWDEDFAGWMIAGSDKAYPTLRAALRAMQEHQA